MLFSHLETFQRITGTDYLGFRILEWYYGGHGATF
jgi:hypothetical protein